MNNSYQSPRSELATYSHSPYGSAYGMGSPHHPTKSHPSATVVSNNARDGQPVTPNAVHNPYNNTGYINFYPKQHAAPDAYPADRSRCPTEWGTNPRGDAGPFASPCPSQAGCAPSTCIPHYGPNTGGSTPSQRPGSGAFPTAPSPCGLTYGDASSSEHFATGSGYNGHPHQAGGGQGYSQTVSDSLGVPLSLGGARGRDTSQMSVSASSNNSSKRRQKQQHRRGSGDQKSHSGTGLLAVRKADGASQSGGSNASFTGEGLPLCPDDADCPLINDRTHQHRYAHTCLLFPCYHGNIHRHAKLFRHVAGQIAATQATGLHSQSLTSVTFAAISPDAPNATRLTVVSLKGAAPAPSPSTAMESPASNGSAVPDSVSSYDIYGDWSQVKVHTFKRYLHQVFNIEPRYQQLSLCSSRSQKAVSLSDDLATVQEYLAKHIPIITEGEGSSDVIITVADSSKAVSDRERQKIREALIDEL